MIVLDNAGTRALSLINTQNGANVEVNFSDYTTTTGVYARGVPTLTTISSGTTTSICATPAASTIRDIDYVNIYNTYAGSQNFTVQITSGSGGPFILVFATLAQNESLNYTHGSGWCAMDANGNRKEALGTILPSLTVTGNATIGGTLGVTGVATFTAQPILSSLTASQAVFSDGSKGLVSNAITGSGSVVMSTSPQLTTSATTNSTTFSLVNTTATTVNFAGGASVALNIGNASGTNTVLGVSNFSQGVNGTLGATTPAAATVTTLSATGAVIAAGTGATLASTISMNANTTGQPAYFTAAGTDTNVGIDLNTKGTGNARTNVNGSVVTVTSSAGLAVTGALSATGAPTSATSGLDTLWYNNTGDYSAQWIRHDRASGGTAAKMISFADSSNTVVGSITANGTTTAYNTTSPRHLKQNITDADREVSRKIVMTTRIREYEWMRFPGKKHIGVVVDEVIRSGFRGAVYKNAYGGAEAVDKTAWVFHSVATLQIHDAEIQSALSRLAKLEAAAAAAGWAV